MSMIDNLASEFKDFACVLRDFGVIGKSGLEALGGPHAGVRVDDACAVQDICL